MKLKLIFMLVCYLHDQHFGTLKVYLISIRIWLGWHGKVYPQPFSTVQWLVACAYWYSLPLTTQGLTVQWLVVCAYQHSLPLTTQGLTVQWLVACAYLKWSKPGHREALGTRLDGKAVHGAICRTKIEAKRAFVQTSISCLHSTFITHALSSHL